MASGDEVPAGSLLHFRVFSHSLGQPLPDEVTLTSQAGGSFGINNGLYNGGIAVEIAAPQVPGTSQASYRLIFPQTNQRLQPGSYTGKPGDNGFSFNTSPNYYLAFQTTDWQILEAVYNPDGTLARLAANFEWSTADGQSVLQGEVRYCSSYPLRSSLAFTNATFTVSGSADAVTISVQRNGDFSAATSVGFHTEDYSARANRDYQGVQGTLNWVAGDSTPKTFTIPLLHHPQPQDQIFFVRLDGEISGSLVTAAVVIAGNAQPSVASLPAPNGTVDRSYPVYLTNASTVTLYQVLPASDGSVFVVGHFNMVGGNFVPGLVRLDPQGQVDLSFKAQLPARFVAGALALQPDGKLIVSGAIGDSVGNTTDTLVRLDADGSLDAGFQGPTLHAGGVFGLTLQKDHRLVVYGNFLEGNGLLRLNADGSSDASFARPSTQVLTEIKFALVQPDGKLLYCNEFGQVTRLNSDGSTDPSFEAAAMLSPDQTASTIALQADGKLLGLGSDSDTKLQRFNHDGTLDAGFSFEGTTISKEAKINAIALQPDGKVLVGLATQIDSPTFTGGLLRLNTDGTLDPTFQAGEELPIGISTLAFNPDGTVFLTGEDFASSSQYDLRTIFARLAAYPGGVEPHLTMHASQTTLQRGSDGAATLTFTRDGDLSAPLTVLYQLKGNAIAGTDYNALSGHKTIKAGQSTATIKIKPLANGQAHGTTTVRVVLPPSSRYQSEPPASIKVRIVDPVQ